MRRAHLLRANERSARPQLLAWLAVDSSAGRDPDGRLVERFQSATATIRRASSTPGTYTEHTIESADPAGFLAELLSNARSKHRLIVVSRNPARDLALLDAIRWLRGQEWEFGHAVMGTRLTLIPVGTGNRRVLFCAHTNLFPYLPRPAGDAGQQVATMRQTWLSHLQLLDELDAGNFHLTLGSQALAIYRHRYMEHPIYIHGDESVDRLERKAALGALYQPFFAGQSRPGRYYYLDTNAMYPWCMRSFPVPWRLVSHGGALPVGTLSRMLESKLAVATVELETDHAHYPCKVDGRTLFPVGRFTATLTTPDLRHALEHGRIRRVLEYATYDGARLFDRFVDELWKRRQECLAKGDITGAALTKAWMVALYGVWGAWRFEHLLEVADPGLQDGSGELYDTRTQEQRHWVALGGKMFSERRAGATVNGFPAIMAHIAAWGRQRMWALVANAGREHVYFCLSDGLIVDQTGYEHLTGEIRPRTLGKLREKRSAAMIEVRSDTEIILGDHSWTPGVPAWAFPVDDGVLIADLEPHTLDGLAGADPGTFTHLGRTLTLERAIHSGVVSPSGWIDPIRLE